jgi:hypothetical protein
VQALAAQSSASNASKTKESLSCLKRSKTPIQDKTEGFIKLEFKARRAKTPLNASTYKQVNADDKSACCGSKHPNDVLKQERGSSEQEEEKTQKQ